MCRLPARQAEVPSEREGVEPRCRCDQVGGPEPGDETQASVAKDRPSGDRGFAPTSPAHKAQASALPGSPAATDRTSEPVGPTTLDQVAPTSRVIGKRRLELRQGRRESSAHSSNYEVVELSGQAPKGDRGSPLPASRTVRLMTIKAFPIRRVLGCPTNPREPPELRLPSASGSRSERRSGPCGLRLTSR